MALIGFVGIKSSLCLANKGFQQKTFQIKKCIKERFVPKNADYFAKNPIANIGTLSTTARSRRANFAQMHLDVPTQKFEQEALPRLQLF